MGAWGTYPKDSDGALDLFGDICDLINKNFEKVAKGYGGYNYAGAVMLLLQQGVDVDRKIVEKARKAVKDELAATEKNPSGWQDPKKAMKSMKEVIAGFDELLNTKKKPDTILAPLRWLDRKGDRNKSNWSGAGFVD